MSFFSDMGRKPSMSSNPTTVILTKHLSNDYYFERKDHQPNFKFDGKRYPTIESALASVGNNVLNGDRVEFIDTKEKEIRVYTKGSNKCVVMKAGQTQDLTVNF